MAGKMDPPSTTQPADYGSEDRPVALRTTYQGFATLGGDKPPFRDRGVGSEGGGGLLDCGSRALEMVGRRYNDTATKLLHAAGLPGSDGKGEYGHVATDDEDGSKGKVPVNFRCVRHTSQSQQD